MQVENSVTEITEAIEKLKNKLKDLIRNLPTNPKAERLGHNRFTIKSSELIGRNNLSPRFYHFEYQYGKLIEIIDHTPIENIPKRLSQIIRTGKDNQARVWFHPDVIKHLKGVL